MIYSLLYVATVVIINIAFERVDLITLPGGEQWSPVALIVGFVFVIRDYAQREIGHYIIIAMIVGGILSWYMATPEIALASMCAFLIGEFIDWAIYTFTGRPFSQRVLLSSACSTPIDSTVFLAMVGIFSIPSVIIMTASKMVGAFLIYLMIKNKDKDNIAIA